MKIKNTLVDFVHTFFRQTGTTTEAECVCRLQFEKIGIDPYGAWTIYGERFPFINKNGKFVVTGKSVLKEGDVYSPVIGEYLAETRAQIKAYFIAERVFEMVKNDILETVGLLNRAQNNCTKNAVRGDEHVLDLIDSVEEE